MIMSGVTTTLHSFAFTVLLRTVVDRFVNAPIHGASHDQFIVYVICWSCGADEKGFVRVVVVVRCGVGVDWPGCLRSITVRRCGHGHEKIDRVRCVFCPRHWRVVGVQ